MGGKAWSGPFCWGLLRIIIAVAVDWEKKKILAVGDEVKRTNQIWAGLQVWRSEEASQVCRSKKVPWNV